MRNSRAKRDHILKAAAKLFIEHGFEGTTLAGVAKASGAAVGSLTHFFGDKSELAAAVLEEVARPLIVHVEAALGSQTKDVRAAVHAVLSACWEWAAGHPAHPVLIAQLEASIPKREANASQTVRQEMMALLAKWAEPLMATQRLAPRSPELLHAIIMAPVLDILKSGAGLAESENALQGLQVLTEAAMAALVGSLQRSKPDRRAKPTGNPGKAAPSLAVAPAAQGSFLLPSTEK